MVTLRVRSVIWFATGVVLAVLTTLLVTQAWQADAAAGDKDSTFVPVPPCRLFDTRPGEEPAAGTKQPLGPGESNVRAQQVTGSVGNCVGIPADATAVSMNVTIVNPTAQSNLRIFPANVATPNASNLNWLPGQSPTPNKVDVKLSSKGQIKLFNFNGTVDVVADVVGYYTNSTLKELAVQPFVISAYDEDGGELTLPAKSHLDLEVTAPVAGQVTINYSASISNTLAGGISDCAPFLSTKVPTHILQFNREGLGQFQAADETKGIFGGVAGTATFDIAANTKVKYSLACEEWTGAGEVSSLSMNALFTPSP